MNISDTLSVDPGRATLGTLHPELATQFLRKKSITRRIRPSSCRSRMINFMLAQSVPRSNRVGAVLFLLRMALAALLTVSGAFIISGEIAPPETFIDPYIYAWLEITAGIMLALGFLTRVAMAMAVTGFGILACQSVINGVFNMEAMVCCLSSLSFFLLGAGKYSGDFLIKKGLTAHAIKRRHRYEQKLLSYKAFHYATRSC